MSKQSYFICKKCQRYGGCIDWFKRRTTDMDIIWNYAFLVKHLSSCFEENICVVGKKGIPVDFKSEKCDDLKEYFPDLKTLQEWGKDIDYHINLLDESNEKK